MVNDDWKRVCAEVLFGRLPILAGTVVGIMAVALAVALFYPPTYEANGSLMLRSKTVQSSVGSLDVPDSSVTEPTEEDLVSEQQLLTSSRLIERTILRLLREGHIDKPAHALSDADPGLLSKLKAFLKKRDESTAGDGADPALIKTVESIRRTALTASIVRDSTIIVLRLRGPDPDRAERFLDTLMSEYLQYRLDVLHPTDQRRFFRERRDFYNERLQALEQKQKAATDATSLEELESEIAQNIEIVRTLTVEHSTMQNQLLEQRQRTQMLETALDNKNVSYFAFLDNDVLEHLSEQLMALTIERGEIRRQFLDTSPQVQAIDQTIAETSEKLRAEVETIYRDAVEKQKTLMAQIRMREFTLADLRERIAALQEEAVQFQQLSREAELLRASYESFARRSEQAQISEAIAASASSGDVSILSRPIYTADKVFPNTLLTLVLGMMLALSAAITLAFTVEFFDHTIRRASDVTQLTDLPVVGSIRKVDC